MTYKEFVQTMQESMKQELGDGYTVQIVDITKNNGIAFTGISVRKDGESACPVLYMEGLYEKYRAGGSLKELTAEILRAYEENARLPISKNQLEDARKWENVRDHIGFRLVNHEQNKERLADLVYRRYLDLAVLYYVDFNGDDLEQYSFCVTRSLLKVWNISEEELDRTACRNRKDQNSTVIRSIYDVLGSAAAKEDLEECQGALELYILSNRKGMFGASAVLDQEALHQFAAEKNANILLMPASVHEMLLLPEEEFYEIKELQKMVESINGSCVAAEEVLSSHVYRLSMETKVVTIADECGIES